MGRNAGTLARGRRFSGWWLGLAAAGAAALAGGRAWRRRRAGPRLVGDVMVRPAVTLSVDATIMEAARRMAEANVGMLPVTADGVLRGVVTDRDLVVRAVANGADPSAVTAGECMTTEAIAARPDWTVDEAMRVMAACQIGRLPVVDEANRVIGMVSLSTLALRGPGGEALETAREVARRSARAA